MRKVISVKKHLRRGRGVRGHKRVIKKARSQLALSTRNSFKDIRDIEKNQNRAYVNQALPGIIFLSEPRFPSSPTDENIAEMSEVIGHEELHPVLNRISKKASIGLDLLRNNTPSLIETFPRGTTSIDLQLKDYKEAHPEIISFIKRDSSGTFYAMDPINFLSESDYEAANDMVVYLNYLSSRYDMIKEKYERASNKPGYVYFTGIRPGPSIKQIERTEGQEKANYIKDFRKDKNKYLRLRMRGEV
jgi:hypothetical protein